MTTRSHHTVSGHRIDYEPTPEVEAFLRRLEAMIDDPKVDEQRMIGFAHSVENPILDQTLVPGQAMVTKAVLEDPVYDVVRDMLFRKRIVQEDVDVDELAARYTMSVQEAAAELGVAENAIRQAIAAKRLASWRKEGRHMLDPDAVRRLEVGTRRPAGGSRVGAPLDVQIGHGGGYALKIKGSDAKVERVAGNVLRGEIPQGWRALVVVTSSPKGRRAFRLEPSEETNEVAIAGFFVRGRFAIAEKANSDAKVDAMWLAAR